MLGDGALQDHCEHRSTEGAADLLCRPSCIQRRGRSPADIRAEFLSGRQQPFSIDEVLRRGVERGEIDPERLTPRIATVALDLLGHELLMTLQPVPEETVAEIVDEIFLPLVRKAPPTGSDAANS